MVKLASACACAAALAACVAIPKRLVLPDEMRAPRAEAEPEHPPSTGTWADEYSVAPTDDGKRRPIHTKAPPPRPDAYTVRLAEGRRVWEVAVPDDAGAYELRLPIGAGGVQATAADREISSGPAPGGDQKATDARAAATARSLLVGLGNVTELYRDGRFELALVELGELERDYPQEARVHAMKGSVLRRLGRAGLARKAWERALSLDPDDVVVAEALRGLEEAR